MKQIVKISLDAMGGDIGPAVIVPAALDALKKTAHLHLILVGDEKVIQDELSKAGTPQHDRIEVLHTTQKVEMDDPPSVAMRTKKDSSMRVALNQVKSGAAHACVSAGNTGALMAIARFVLKMLPGVDRPAIITSLPNMTGHTHMLDLGANAQCEPAHLFQFAVMGSVLASAVDGNDSPRVGLLNIGEEEMKGNEIVKETAALLGDSSLNYIGFVEGNDIFTGDVDVVVTDGFTGNVSLKTTEGLAKMISGFLKEAFMRNWMTKLVALLALPVLSKFRKRIDPRRYNGASLLGLRGIVIKSHGGADAMAFTNAIKIAVLEVEKAVPERISSELETLLITKKAV